jgi:hypothetical protein
LIRQAVVQDDGLELPGWFIVDESQGLGLAGVDAVLAKGAATALEIDRGKALLVQFDDLLCADRDAITTTAAQRTKIIFRAGPGGANRTAYTAYVTA